MSISLHEIRVGMTIIYNNEPYHVLKANFVRMQQRKPVMQTKLRNLISGKIIENNFKPGDKFEEAEVERKKINYLYHTHDQFHFMDNETYEEVMLSKDIIGEAERLLKEGSEIQTQVFNDKIIGIQLPPKMDFKVVTAAPGVKGDTAQGRVTKTATIETGFTVNVPLFIKDGDIIRINTESGEYVERVNEEKS